jgi:hypothetical protein
LGENTINEANDYVDYKKNDPVALKNDYMNFKHSNVVRFSG